LKIEGSIPQKAMQTAKNAKEWRHCVLHFIFILMLIQRFIG
jgi:hypothetical protein